LSGLARIVRSLVPPALENVVSWEERDISHSSAERFIIPQAFILSDYMVRELNRVIDGLTIDREAVDRNLNLSNDSILSEYVVTLLTKAGLERPKAHEKLRMLSDNAQAAGTSLLDAVRNDADLTNTLNIEQLKIEEYYESIREVSRRIVKEATERSK
jgi:adenylosuccinate lyase